MVNLINSTREYDKKFVFNFPYEELLNINGVDLTQIRRCLPYLLKISKIDLFYNNLKAVKITLDFVVSNLSIFDDIYAEDVFVGLLTLLNQIVVRLGLCKKLDNVFPEIKNFLDILLYISELDIFRSNCSRLCEPILLEVIQLNKNNFTSIDKSLARILENFKEIKAKREIARISEVILERFPLDSSSYILSACWLMEYSIEALKDLQLRNIQDNETMANSMRTIYTFYQKIGKSVRTNQSEYWKYKKYFSVFRKDLMNISPKLLSLCCARNMKEEARMLLGIVLYEFLTEQAVMSYEIENLLEQEIQQFPMNLKEWSRKFSCSFFWICHLLYAHKSYVWTSADILLAIHRLFITKKYTKLINVSILKSICYIYPLAVQGCYNHRRELLGDDILNMVNSRCLSRINNVLSLEISQIIWIIHRGSTKLKTAGLKFWLNHCSTEHMDILKEVLQASKSERILIEILICCSASERLILSRTVDLIYSVRSTALIKSIQMIIPKFSGDIKLFEILLEASDYKVPQNKNVSLNLLKSICCTITAISNNIVLTNLCGYTKELLASLNTDKQAIQFICNSRPLLRFLVIRLDENNDENLSIKILELLRMLVKYQRKSNDGDQDKIIINLAPLMPRSKLLVEKTVGLLCEILNLNTLLTLEDASILELLYKLCDLTYVSSLSEKRYICLYRLLKLYSSPLIGLPILGMFVEDICLYSNRKNISLVEGKFVLLWIHLMFSNPNRSMCFLPDEKVIRNYVLRHVIMSDTVKKYSYFISETYQMERLTSEYDQIINIY